MSAPLLPLPGASLTLAIGGRVFGVVAARADEPHPEGWRARTCERGPNGSIRDGITYAYPTMEDALVSALHDILDTLSCD